jgi:peptidase inhibitor family I36
VSTRRIALIGSILASILLPLLPGTAAARDLPPLIARMFPAGLPAGTRIVDADTISFAHGAATADLAPTDSVCPSGYVCLWEDAGYTGRRVAFSACDVDGDGVCDWVNLILFNFNDEMTSWKNAKTVDAKWSFNAGGGGTQRCMNAGFVNPQLSGSNNDQASAIKIFNTSTAC